MKSTKTFLVEEGLWKEFKKHCIDKGISISQELEDIIKGALYGKGK